MLIRAECKVSEAEEQQAWLKTTEASTRLLQRKTLHFIILFTGTVHHNQSLHDKQQPPYILLSPAVRDHTGMLSYFNFRKVGFYNF